MNVYPYTTPIILNDSIFVFNGGQTGTTSAAQRQAAYLIAEQQATSYVGTFLLPTIVTGTYGYSQRIVTDYGYVHRLLAVNVLNKENPSSQCVLNIQEACGYIWSDQYGYVDVNCALSRCGCSNVYSTPYQIQLAYEAGLPTGTASQPAFLMALSMAAQISLNEMVYPSQNEGTGDVGIEQFTSLGYSEKRVKMGRSAFGSSAKAYKIAQLIRSTVRLSRPALVL